MAAVARSAVVNHEEHDWGQEEHGADIEPNDSAQHGVSRVPRGQPKRECGHRHRRQDQERFEESAAAVEDAEEPSLLVGPGEDRHGLDVCGLACV